MCCIHLQNWQHRFTPASPHRQVMLCVKRYDSYDINRLQEFFFGFIIILWDHRCTCSLSLTEIFLYGTWHNYDNHHYLIPEHCYYPVKKALYLLVVNLNSSPPHPLVTINLLCLFGFVYSRHSYNEIIQYIALFVWLLWFSIMFSQITHVTPYISASFPFMPK